MFGIGPNAVNPVVQSVQDSLDLTEQARMLRMQRAWQAYHGDQPRPLRVRQGQPDDNIIANFARVIIDKGVSFLFGQEVTFDLGQDGDEATAGQNAAAQTYLDSVWRANRKMTLLHKLAMNGGICGHAFVKLMPGQLAGGLPRLMLLDPQLTHVETDPDDVETVTGYRVQWTGKDPVTGKPLAKRQLHRPDGQVWQITDQQSLDGGPWLTTGETVWPYAFPAIVDCQNLPCAGEVWGISDLEDDIRGIQGSVNFVASNIGRILRFHSHPKTWGSGFSAAQLDVAIDQTIVLPNTDAKLANLEMASDLQSSLDFFRALRQALYEIARVPEIATGTLNALGQISGVALKVLYAPLVEKTETKRQTYGDLLVELNRRILAMAGHGDQVQTAIHWPNLIPGDEMTEAQTALLYKQIGVSDDTLMQQLGFDPDAEKAKSAEEAKAAMALLPPAAPGQPAAQAPGVPPGKLLTTLETGMDRSAIRPT